MREFHDEANTGNTRDRSASVEEPTIVRSKTIQSSSALKVRRGSSRKPRPSSKHRNTMTTTSMKDPKLAAVA